MGYETSQRMGKERKAGKEAPSARVYEVSGKERIIGMIAPHVQIIASVYSLRDEPCAQLITALQTFFKGENKLSGNIVCNNDFETMETFTKEKGLENFTLLQDSKGDFAKRFGTGLENEKEKLANALFLVDKEGVFHEVIYDEIPAGDQLEAFLNKARELIDAKQKGHSHENWMRY